MIFSDSASLYFYSSLFQGNAALITLTSMFIIYKRQSLDTKFDTLERRFLDYFISAHQINLFHSSIFEIRTYKEELFHGLPPEKIVKIKSFLEGHAWQYRIAQLDSMDLERKNLWSAAKKPAWLLFSILILSIVLLPFSGVLHKNISYEILFFIIFIVAQSYGLLLLIKFIIFHSK